MDDNAIYSNQTSTTLGYTTSRPKPNRTILWAVLTGVALIIVIILSIIVPSLSPADIADQNIDVGDEVNTFTDIDDGPFLSINDSYITQATLGNDISSKITDYLRTTINSPTERTFAVEPIAGTTYSATIQADSLARSTQSEYILYFFDIAVQDGRTYHATVRCDNGDSLYYFAMALHRTVPAAQDAYLLVGFLDTGNISSLNNSVYYDRDAVIAQYIAWGQSLGFTPLTATVSDTTR